MKLSKETISNIHAAAHQVALEAARKEALSAAEYIETYERVIEFLVNTYEKYSLE